jgi:hypothetical protein
VGDCELATDGFLGRQKSIKLGIYFLVFGNGILYHVFGGGYTK